MSDNDKQKKGLIARLAERLGKTRGSLSQGLAAFFGDDDDELLEEIETRLLMADVGIETTRHVIATLSDKLSRKQLKDADTLVQTLKDELRSILEACNQPLDIDTNKHPYVILVVGINGAGKTTTIGKLARQFKEQGQDVMLAAGDTFRAAAVEQLQTWGERNDIPVVAQGSGADSAAVIHDALQSAQSRGTDILIADTAGRLHTQQGLMEELAKVKRVMGKLDNSAPHETLLVLDAGTGQNALIQAREFHQAMDVSGIVLTKLDGTAKGGILFAIAQELKIPIRYIGVGEGIEDLQVFDADRFIEALFSE
jgi:fused signal recognition particle receptor